MFFALQTTSLRGVGVVATVEESVKGALPPFDQGTVGINVMPLGSAEVRHDLARHNNTWHDMVGVFVHFVSRNLLQTQIRGTQKAAERVHMVHTWQTMLEDTSSLSVYWYVIVFWSLSEPRTHTYAPPDR